MGGNIEVQFLIVELESDCGAQLCGDKRSGAPARSAMSCGAETLVATVLGLIDIA